MEGMTSANPQHEFQGGTHANRTDHRRVRRPRPRARHRTGHDGWRLVSPRAAPSASSRSPPGCRDPASVTTIAGDVADRAHRARLVSRDQPARRRSTCWSTTPARSAPLPCGRSPSCPPPNCRTSWRVNVHRAVRADRGVAARTRPRPAGSCWTSPPTPPSSTTPTGAATARARPRWTTSPLTFGVENLDIACYAVDPGDMRTDMQQAAFPGEDISDRTAPSAVVPALLGPDQPAAAERAVPGRPTSPPPVTRRMHAAVPA